MLVDLRLSPSDMFMVQRGPDGTTTLSIPYDILTRAFAALQANRAQFDAQAQQETRQ